MFKLKKLNSRGVVHHALLMLIVVMAIAGFGAYQVSKSHADSQYQYNARNAYGCHPGKEKTTGNCTLFKNSKGEIQAGKIEAECASFHLQYKLLPGNPNKQCAEICVGGYHISASEPHECKPGSGDDNSGGWTDHPGGGSGGGGSGSASNCADLKRGDGTGGGCGACYQNFTDYTPSTTNDLCIRNCTGAHQFTNNNDNKCHCVEGYSMQSDDTCKAINTGGNNGGGNSGSHGAGDGTTDNAAGILKCTQEHKVWHPAKAICGPECATGYATATEGLCVEGTPLPGHTIVPGPVDPPEVTEGSFKITVYKDKDFKGASETFTTEQATLSGKWNDKISSYKIQKGRWQLCEDANFTKSCNSPWASNPDLKKKSDTISSLRPVTSTALVDASSDVIAQCLDAYSKPVAADADNACPEGSTLTCPEGFTLDESTCKEEVLTGDTIVPVDTSFKGKDGKKECELLGREWIGKVNRKVINNGQYGCSLVTCDRKADGAPKQFPGGPVCVSNKYAKAYAQDLGENKCKTLHRVWISQVQRCAQMPNQKDKNQTLVKAPQCAKEYSTYYIYKAANQEDECFKPDFFQQVKGVANVTGGAVGAGLQLGPKAFCSTVKGGNYHWTGKKCVIDRKKCWDGSMVAVNRSCPPKPASTTTTTSTVEVPPAAPVVPGKPIKCTPPAKPNTAGTKCIKTVTTTIACDAACQEIKDQHGGTYTLEIKKVYYSCDEYNDKFADDSVFVGCPGRVSVGGDACIPGTEATGYSRKDGATIYYITDTYCRS